MKNKLVFCVGFSLMAVACGEKKEASTSDDKIKNEIAEKRKERSLGIYDIQPFANARAEEYYFAGNDARHAGDFQLAKSYYLKAYEQDPVHVVNLNNLANSCMVLDEREEAEGYLRIALDLDPSAGITYVNYTNFSVLTNDFQKGSMIGRMGLRYVADSMSIGIIYANLSLLYANAGVCDSAIIFLKQTLPYSDKLDGKAMMSLEEEIYTLCRD